MSQVEERVLFREERQVWSENGEEIDVCHVLCRRFEGSVSDRVFIELWRVNDRLGLVDYQVKSVGADEAIPVPNSACIRMAIAMFDDYAPPAPSSKTNFGEPIDN